jgi:putative transposase
MFSVAKQRHFYGLNHVHYITTSTYRRARLFDSERFKRRFVAAWQDLHEELRFRIIGYVLMPEHFHILLWPSDLANPSEVMQRREERTAKFILRNLRDNRQFAWCGRMLDRLELPPTVHHHARHRVWQRRFYDFNVWREKKIQEKLDYMHNNPVERRLVEKPGDWPWSSWRFYYMEDSSVLAMDRMP